MKVHLSFDVEIWCPSWEGLDDTFAAQFERYVYGRSAAGEFALPAHLAVLKRHGLKAVFFVEALFAARFGLPYLRRIVDLIQDAGQEVQLHLHPEWCDEIRPLPLPGATHKRQHLSYYSLEEQTQLLRLGLSLLKDAGATPINAFRPGSFACNADTFAALAAVGLAVDSSLNPDHKDSGLDLRGRVDFVHASHIEGVLSLPMTVFRDGLGRSRPAQVGAAGISELRAVLAQAHAQQRSHAMLLSHNFEALVPGQNRPDGIVFKRFTQLCEYLATAPQRYEVCGLSGLNLQPPAPPLPGELHAPLLATLQRHSEQIQRRFL